MYQVSCKHSLEPGSNSTILYDNRIQKYVNTIKKINGPEGIEPSPVGHEPRMQPLHLETEYEKKLDLIAYYAHLLFISKYTGFYKLFFKNASITL